MVCLVRPLGAALLLCLSVAAFTSPASAWRIVAGLGREGNNLNPTEVEESFLPPGDKVVSVSQSDGYPDNSEIGGSARVDLAQGTLSGSAHAVALLSAHQIRFVSILEEELTIAFPPTLPIAERIVRVRASVSAGFAETNVATASGIFSISANGRRGAVAFGTNVAGGWTVIDQGVGVTINPTAGGEEFEIALANGTGGLSIDVQLEGTASAHVLEGTGLADVPAASASLELQIPAGATFTSGSGAFLVPEPARGALALVSACVLAALRQRKP
jgi:hypothetical protein